MESNQNNKASWNTGALFLNLDAYNSDSDSDFRPEDHMNSDSEASALDNGEDGLEFCNSDGGSAAAAVSMDGSSTSDPISTTKAPEVVICAVCLQYAVHQVEDVLQCSGCCITLHRGCYFGGSLPLSGAAWMCEACSAGVNAPTCELCPNTFGLFKRTTTNNWVHLICALYVPRVVFTNGCVKLLEAPNTQVCGQACSLCPDIARATTGKCIKCDDGMCKEHFHATCAHAAGLLVEPNRNGSADPYFALCGRHAYKESMLIKRQNFLKLVNNMQVKLGKQSKQEVDSCTQLVTHDILVGVEEQPPAKKQTTECSPNIKKGKKIKVNSKTPHLKKGENINSLKTLAADSLASIEIQKCAICKQTNEQILFVECVACKRHYHVTCLDPPLISVPKKSKWWVWQCCLCDNTEKDEMPEENTGGRKLRPRKGIN